MTQVQHLVHSRHMYTYAKSMLSLSDMNFFLFISPEEPNQYQIPIPRWGIKINILAKLWTNPIPNSNSRVRGTLSEFLWNRQKRWMNKHSIQHPWTYILSELGPNPIPNSNSEVGYQDQHTGQAMGQSNT